MSQPRKAARVFHMVDSLHLGGSEHQMVEVARRMDARGYRVTVGCLKAEGPFLEVLRQVGIPVVEFRPGRGLLRPRGIYQLLRLAMFLRRERFDVVHTHDLWSNLMGVPAAWLARTPIIISSRRDLATLSWYTPRRMKIIRLLHRMSTAVVANSDAVREYLAREESLDASRIRVLRNGVDFERFSRVPRSRERLFPELNRSHKLVAVVANMNSPTKGHTYLIEAARTICRDFRETRFILIGDGPERPKLEQQAAEAGVRENFLFLGRRRDVPELLSCCDLFVLPSTAEGLPNVVLEALAVGLPVVATRAGGTVEIVEDGVSGLLVPPRDPEALAEAVLRILHDPRLARKLAVVGNELARSRFSFDGLLKKLDRFYAELLLRNGGSRGSVRLRTASSGVRISSSARL